MTATGFSLKERVSVTGTGKDEKNFPKGITRKVHPRVASKLIKAGIVVKSE